MFKTYRHKPLEVSAVYCKTKGPCDLGGGMSLNIDDNDVYVVKELDADGNLVSYSIRNGVTFRTMYDEAPEATS